MDNQLKRLLNLVRRTGDRLVVTDPNGEDTYVLMGLEAYEKLADYVSPPESWEPPRFDDDFIDDHEDDYGDYYNESDDFDEDWEIPDEFLTEEARVRKNKGVGMNDNLSPDDKKTEETPKNNQSSWQSPNDIWETMKPAGDDSETWNPAKFGPNEQKIVEEKFGSQNNEIPSFLDAPSPAATSLAKADVTPAAPAASDTPSASKNPNDEPGEEQFYLEPVE